MTLIAAAFGWSLFLAIILLAMQAGVFAPRPILTIAVSGSLLWAAVLSVLIFTLPIGAAQ